MVDRAMARLYRVEIVEDKKEGCFALSCPELPGCITCADTIEQGMEMLEDAKRCWFTACVEDGIEIPRVRDQAPL